MCLAPDCGAGRDIKGHGNGSILPVAKLTNGTGTRARLIRSYSAATDTAVQHASEAAAEPAKFDWTRQWYALAIVEDLDPRLPHLLQLLGKDLVVWQGKDGNWNVFEDRCPHRLAPLSEGRINPEDGTLQCSYHGWRFNTAGNCVAIPQAASQEAEKVAAASSRACAKTHPSKVAFGVLWVWGDGSATAHIDAAAKQPPFPEFPSQSGELRVYQKPFRRDLPIDCETLLENVMDPAHLPFSHHGVVRHRDTVTYGDSALKLETGDEVHSFAIADYKTAAVGRRHFTAPGTLQVANIVNKEQDRWVQFSLYVTPTKPGYARLIEFSYSNYQLPWMKRMMRGIHWFNHSFKQNEVFDGDNHTLHVAERAMAAEYRNNGKGWRKLYYTPTAADAAVTAWRQFLDKAGGGGPWGYDKYHKFPRVTLSRRETLDRYNQHTIHCKACREALRNVQVMIAVASSVVLVCCAAGLMAALSQGIGALAAPQWRACGVVAVLAAAARQLLQKIEKKLVFEDYVHGLK